MAPGTDFQLAKLTDEAPGILTSFVHRIDWIVGDEKKRHIGIKTIKFHKK